MPVPAFNVLNGGSHAGNKLAMQEFMILPVGASSFTEAMKMGSETYHNLKAVIKAKYGLDACNVGDEGGFAPNIQDNMEGLLLAMQFPLQVCLNLRFYSLISLLIGLELLNEAIAKAGYTGKIKIGMDVAASEFYKEGLYDLDFKNPDSPKDSWLPGDQLKAVYQEMISKYPIVTIEDPYDQDDWDAWTDITETAGIQVRSFNKVTDTSSLNIL